MKKVLKVLSVVMAMMLLISAISVAPFAAEAKPVINLGAAAVEAEPGATVAIPVTAANFAGKEIFGVSLEIALGGLTDVTLTAGSIDPQTDMNVTIANDILKLAEINDVKDAQPVYYEDGVLFTINGVVGVEGATHALAIKKAMCCNYGAADTDPVEVPVDVAGTTVTVKAAMPAEPVLDASLDMTSGIIIGDTISAQFVVNKAAADKYADFKIVVTRNKCDVNYNFVEDVTEFNKASAIDFSGSYFALYSGIGMYELNMPLTAVVYAYDADGNKVAYSNTFTATVKELATDLYNQYTGHAKEAVTKTAVTDLLNMGAEMQKFFSNGKTCDLAGVALANEGFDQSFASAEVEKSRLNNTSTSNNTADCTIAAVANLSSSPALQYAIMNLTNIANFDANKLAVNVSYTNGLTAKPVTLDLMAADLTFFQNNYYYIFNKVALYDSNKVVKMTVNYDGAVVASNDYTIESFIFDNYENARMQDALKALAKFGFSIRTYFNVQ